MLARSGLFDRDHYLERRPDVAAARMDPLAHYVVFGTAEGADPNPFFDTRFYLERRPTLRSTGDNPLAHYVTRGAGEGLDPGPRFSTRGYLWRYPDVARAGLNPLAHFLAYGRGEGRSPRDLRLDHPSEREEAAVALLEGLPRATDTRLMHALAASHGLLPDDPRFLHLEMDVTSGCNIRCRMCYVSLERGAPPPSSFLTPEAFEAEAGSLLPSVHTVTLSLGSEPLVSPHFPAILEIAAHRRPRALEFSTNGMLLTGRVIDAVIRHGVTRVCVSVDGATRETFEHIRRGASFERVLGNVRALVTRREELGRDVPVVRFDVVMMRSNVRELEALVTLAAETGAGEINFFHMVAYEGLGMEGESLVGDKALSNEYLERALARARRVGLVVTSYPKLFPEPGPAGGASGEAPGPFDEVPYCRYPFHHVSVNAGGRVLACPFAHGEPAFGTVSAGESLEGVWMGPRFAELRARILRNDPPRMCRRCSFLASRCPDRPELFEPRKPSWGEEDR